MPPLEADAPDLLRLLAGQLAAVSQHFLHILKLRKAGEKHLAARINEVDQEDFKNAMLIIDLMIAHDMPIVVAEHRISPGADVRSMVHGEIIMERHLSAVMNDLKFESPQARARMDRAAAPRADYRSWLEDQAESVDEHNVDPVSSSTNAVLLPHLLLFLEQTLVSAFVRWHGGDRPGADVAWQMSGATMIYLTALAPFSGSADPGMHGVTIPGADCSTLAGIFQADLDLAEQCATVAHAAADQRDDAFGRLCQRIALDYETLAVTPEGGPIEVEFGRSKTFMSFERARKRMAS